MSLGQIRNPAPRDGNAAGAPRPLGIQNVYGTPAFGKPILGCRVPAWTPIPEPERRSGRTPREAEVGPGAFGTPAPPGNGPRPARLNGGLGPGIAPSGPPRETGRIARDTKADPAPDRRPPRRGAAGRLRGAVAPRAGRPREDRRQDLRGH